MDFVSALKREDSRKLTENFGVAYKNAGRSSNLDLFAQVGALRTRSEQEIRVMFAKAYNESPILALKMAFYAGDVRGGLGERRTFRIFLRWLIENDTKTFIKNFHLIPHYNRWDTLFQTLEEPDSYDIERFIFNFLARTLESDLEKMANREAISLCAKWLPSENSSSEKTIRLAKKIRKGLGLSSKEYRKLLSRLRGYIDIVEKKMSARKWGSINYEEVPSYAMKNYKRAFIRNDDYRFYQYINDVKDGRKEIKAGVLYPYDLIEEYLGRYADFNDVIEEQWKALPNYVRGENDYLVMADVSGSMTGRPMATSVGLAIYFSERNRGRFRNLYLTFTEEPKLIDITRLKSLKDKVDYVETAGVGYNTDLEAAFELVLNTAIYNGVPDSELPRAIIVISDMEIDRYLMRYGTDFVDEMRKRFNRNGYTFPKLILWNASARNSTFLSQDPEVIYVSGSSVSTFKELVNSLEGKTAEDVMLETLLKERYDQVSIAD